MSVSGFALWERSMIVHKCGQVQFSVLANHGVGTVSERVSGREKE